MFKLSTVLFFSTALTVFACSGRAYDPQEGLLAFEDAWDIVDRTYFDSTFAGLDWDEVRERYRPIALQAASYAELKLCIQDMLDELGASHFFLYSASSAAALDGEYRGAGTTSFEIRITGGHVIVSRIKSHRSEASISPGWILKSVRGESVEDILDALPDDLPGYKKSLAQWEAVRRALSGPIDTAVTLEFQDSEGTVHKVEHILGEARRGESVKFGHFPRMNVTFDAERLQTSSGFDVGYVAYNLWMLPSSQAFDGAIDTLRTAEALIIDLRGNVGGALQMISGVAGYFVPAPSHLGTMTSRNNRFEINANPRVVNKQGEIVGAFEGPLAILVDHQSYSASELFTAGMQGIGRARVFGRPTPGGALPATFHKLAGGQLVLEHPVADFVLANGARVEGVGVSPDVVIPWDSKRMEQGIDIDLDAAIKWIEQELDQ